METLATFAVLVIWFSAGAWAGWLDADGQDPREWNSHDWLGVTIKTLLGGISLIFVA